MHLPYLADDYNNLGFYRYMDLGQMLASNMGPPSILYRPLGQVYLWMLAKTFGFDPTGFHLIHISILLASAALTIAIFKQLFQNHVYAWAAGTIFLFAHVLHAGPLLWAVGIYDLGANFFMLLSILSFLHRWRWAAVICFPLALGFKESALILPLVIGWLAVARANDGTFAAKIRRAVLPVAPYLLVASIYLTWRMFGMYRTAHPFESYSMSLSGTHLVDNTLFYMSLVLSILNPTVASASFRMEYLSLAGLFLAWYLVRWRRSSAKTTQDAPRHPAATLSPTMNRSLPFFLVYWSVMGLLPVLFFIERHFDYYLSPSAAPLAGLWVLLALAVFRRFSFRVVASAGLLLLLWNSGSWLHGQVSSPCSNAGGSFGANMICIGEASLVTHRQLDEHRAALRHGYHVVGFSGVQFRTLFLNNGLALLYNNPSIRACQFDDSSGSPNFESLEDACGRLLAEVVENHPGRKATFWRLDYKFDPLRLRLTSCPIPPIPPACLETNASPLGIGVPVPVKRQSDHPAH